MAAQGQKRGPDTPSNPRRLATDPCNKVSWGGKFHQKLGLSITWITNVIARLSAGTDDRQPNATRAASHKNSFTNELPHHFALPWIDILNCADLVFADIRDQNVG